MDIGQPPPYSRTLRSCGEPPPAWRDPYQRPGHVTTSMVLSLGGAALMFLVGVVMLIGSGALSPSTRLAGIGPRSGMLLAATGAGAVAVGLLLAVFSILVLRCSHRARVALSVIGAIWIAGQLGEAMAGVFGLVNGAGASLLAGGYVAVAVGCLWTRPATRWFHAGPRTESAGRAAAATRHAEHPSPRLLLFPPGLSGPVRTEDGTPLVWLDMSPGRRFTAVDPSGALLVRGRRRRFTSLSWDAVDAAGDLRVTARERMCRWRGVTVRLPDGRRYRMTKHHGHIQLITRDGAVIMHAWPPAPAAGTTPDPYPLEQHAPQLTLTEVVAAWQLWWLIRIHRARADRHAMYTSASLAAGG